MSLFDTHCHIQSIGGDSADFTSKKWHDGGVTNPDEVIGEAKKEGVDKIICVGTGLNDSKDAVEFVKNRDSCWASVGVHPHEAKKTLEQKNWHSELQSLSKKDKVVAVGECGLDYYYEHSPKREQRILLEHLLDTAQQENLPVIFHVRDAYDDFWPIFDNFHSTRRPMRGVLHSFSSDKSNLDKAIERGLYVGFNGIMTFTKDKKQLDSAKTAPVDKMLLETDSPYLTPVPFRGKVCKPNHIKTICEFLCHLRGGSFDEFARQTTQNAKDLFKIN